MAKTYDNIFIWAYYGQKVKATVRNEYRHEKGNKKLKAIYPNGIHGLIKEILYECDDLDARAYTLDELARKKESENN